jgi:excisionase family DNA binding protein
MLLACAVSIGGRSASGAADVTNDKDTAMSDTPPGNESTLPLLEPLQVDVIEAARLLRYSRAKIYEMLSRGELPSTRHGASRRIPVTALRAWVEAHTEHGL